MSQPVPVAAPEEPRPGAAAAARSSRNALLVGLGIFTSRFAGLFRTALESRFLGAGVAADAYAAATKIPNFLQNLFGEGTLSASFIPVYARLLGRDEHEAARRLVGAVATLLGIAVTILVALGVVFAPALVRVLDPAFTGERYTLTVHLTRILFPGTGVLVLSAWALGVLNSHRRFLLPYAAPVAWNLAIIAALAWYGPRVDVTRLADRVAWATAIGCVLQLLVQLPLALRLARGLQVGLAWRDPQVTVVRRNFLPAVTSRGVLQISGYLDMAIVGYLGEGMVGILRYASTIYMLPVSLFGMSIAASELPELATAAGDDADAAARVRQRLQGALERVSFFVVPSAVAFIALGDVIAGLLLRGNRFGLFETRLTWAMLAGSAVGLLAATWGRLYSSTFFAFHDTRTPMRFAMVRIAVGAALGAGLAFGVPRAFGLDLRWGGFGLMLGGGIAGWIEYRLLRRALERRIGRGAVPRGALVRVGAAALGAAAVGLAVKLWLPDWGRYVTGPLVLAAFSLFYGLAAWALGVGAAAAIVARVGRVVRRR